LASNADRALARSKEDWVKEFHATHSPPVPIWMAVEAWDPAHCPGCSRLRIPMHPTTIDQLGRERIFGIIIGVSRHNLQIATR
jgi:hypothetical protein